VKLPRSPRPRLQCQRQADIKISRPSHSLLQTFTIDSSISDAENCHIALSHQCLSANDVQMSATGRHVKHSRSGCVLCKKRRVRCSGEKPSCSRCTTDGKHCEYVFKLQWEDDSLRRGVKHGRSQTTMSKVLASRVPISGCVKHFLNFDAADFRENNHSGPPRETGLALKGRRSGLSLLPVIQPSWNMESALDATLYDYYINRVCHHATLLDDTSNSYRRLILPMSMSQDSIRHLILSLGALALATEQTSSTIDFQAVSLRHKQKAFQHLRRDLSQPDLAMSDHNLVAVQLMCVLDVSPGTCHQALVKRIRSLMSYRLQTIVKYHGQPILVLPRP